VHVPLPDRSNIHHLKQQFLDLICQGDVAGFIFEPLIQGAAGMLMYEAPLLDELIALCRQQGVITIADEVMTGFGRTGKFFASDHLLNPPDILCLSKGLTGGYMPMGVTSCSRFIYEAFLNADKTKTFFHGHSYTANPTACSAALASLDLMEQPAMAGQLYRIEAAHWSFMERIKSHAALKAVRVCGTIIAFELNTAEHTHYLNTASENIAGFFLERGILLRPLGNIFYLIPPYVITNDELQYMYQTIEEFLNVVGVDINTERKP
jgi:adenosylmethionine-8-amino-7-oxononanoate aminotransferase